MNTKNLRKILAIPIIIIMLLISGCFNSNTTNSTPYYTISNEYAEYCWFEEGSYWIFMNDSTLFTDTISIIDIIETKRTHTQPQPHNYQAVEMFTKSNIFNIARYEITAGNFEVKAGEMNSLLRLYLSNGLYHLVFLPQYPFGEEIIMGDDIGIYSNIELLNSFELNNNTYTDVYHTRVIVGTNAEYNYWIAKNHSLIKAISTINGQTTSISLVVDNLISVTN